LEYKQGKGNEMSICEYKF